MLSLKQSRRYLLQALYSQSPFMTKSEAKSFAVRSELHCFASRHTDRLSEQAHAAADLSMQMWYAPM